MLYSNGTDKNTRKMAIVAVAATSLHRHYHDLDLSAQRPALNTQRLAGQWSILNLTIIRTNGSFATRSSQIALRRTCCAVVSLDSISLHESRSVYIFHFWVVSTSFSIPFPVFRIKLEFLVFGLSLSIAGLTYLGS